MSKTKQNEVPVDRRESDRRSDDRRQADEPVAADRRKSERRKVQRRRQIDPTTCERDYTDEEIEFMQALDAYKRASGRMFPTCSEILEVIRDMGYVRIMSEESEMETVEATDAAGTDTEVVDLTEATSAE